MTSLLQRLQLLHRLRRRLLLHRRLLAAACAASAVLLGLQAAATPPPALVQVWTAADDVPSGVVLQRSDLARTGFAPGTAPDDVVAEPSEVVGRTVATPLRAGEPVLARRLVGDEMLSGHPGLVAVPVRITDPAVAGMLRVGDRVDLVAADPQGRGDAQLIAADVSVLALPRSGETDALATLPGRLVVVAVPPDASDTLVWAGTAKVVTATWSR